MKLNQIIVFVFLVVIAGSCNSRLINNRETLQGKILDKQNKEGIPNAKIKINSKDTTLEIMANLDGEFKVENISKGNYKIDISAIGYQHLSGYPIKFKDTTQIIIELELGVKLDSVSVNYEGSSIIYQDDSGNVKTAKGKK